MLGALSSVTKSPRAWYRIALAAAEGAGEPDAADIYVFDLIGDWLDDYWQMGGTTTAKTFLDELAKLPDSVKTLRVHVNSPGGDVFSAITIANMLRQQSKEKGRTVEMSIEGLAASAATIITSAGDTIRIADNALMMIHDPWSWTVGNAGDMRKSADELDKVRDQIVATYLWTSSLSAEEISALMAETTWMDAKEAVAKGFATEIVSGLRAAAALRPEAVAKLGDVPDRFRDQVTALLAPPTPAPTPAPAASASETDPADPVEIVKVCNAAGVAALAEALIEAKATLPAVQARVDRAKRITGLCKGAKYPELAAGYIAADTAVEVVQTHLTTITARAAGREIDPSLAPDAGPEPAQIKVTEIYDRYNAAQTAGGKR